MATPNITREIFDGNLTRVTPQGVTNRRVVILGTASDGPMYSPVRVTSAGAAEDSFGSISDGNLVRGCKEALDAQAGFPKNPNVWGMRIGGILASRATKSIVDSNLISLLELESINEGSIYNDIYMKVDDVNYEISIWNPKLKVFNKYSYNWNDPNDSTVDIHSLQELVDSINADRNLSSVMFAATPSLESTTEMVVGSNGVDAIVTENDSAKVSIDLQQVLGDSNFSTHGTVYEGSGLVNGSGNNDTDVTATLNQRFRDVQSAYAIYASDFISVDRGSASHAVIDGFLLNNNTHQNGIRPVLNVTETDDSILAGGGSSASEALLQVVNQGLTFSLDGGSYVESGNGLASVASCELRYNVGDASITAFYDDAATYDDPYGADAAKLDQHSNCPMKLEVQISGGGWVRVYDTADFLTSFTAGQLDITITATARYGDPTTGTLLINAGAGILESADAELMFRISFTTEKVDLNEVQAISALGGNKNNFFIQGNSITFGAGHQENILFRHCLVKYYNPAEMTIALDSTGRGTISIYDAFTRNKNSGAAIDYSAHTCIFGMQMRYYADVADLNSTYYLTGGTNGTNMTTAQLYTDLDEAYDHFSDDFFDICAVMGGTFDAEKTAPNAQGQYTTGNAGFHTQMSDFLNSFNGEMIGVMGFDPIEGSGVGGRILKSDVEARVANLPKVLESFHQPFMFAVDIESIFSAAGTRYGSNSASAVAGLIAAIPVEEALYRYTLPGSLGMVWRYSEIDKLSGRKQIDLMSDARICTGQIDSGVKLTEAKTLAINGSDFENLMTVLILQQTLDLCRSVAKNYIGKVSSQALLQAFQAELNMAIGEALVPKALRGFSAPITMSPGERVVGKLTIPLTLSPQFEIRDVHYTVTLTAEDVVG